MRQIKECTLASSTLAAAVHLQAKSCHDWRSVSFHGTGQTVGEGPDLPEWHPGHGTRVLWIMVTWREKSRVRRNIPAASPAGVVDGSSVHPKVTAIRKRSGEPSSAAKLATEPSWTRTFHTELLRLARQFL